MSSNKFLPAVERYRARWPGLGNLSHASRRIQGCLLLALVGFSSQASATLMDERTPLRVEATLRIEHCHDPDHGSCGVHLFRPHTVKADVRFGTMEMRKALPGANIRVGPFHLEKKEFIEGATGNTGWPTRFRIQILARSPAVYEKSASGARFVGAEPYMRVIASEDFVVSELIAKRDVFVNATVPSVFTALAVRASVSPGSAAVGGLTTAQAPRYCGNLPTSLTSGDSSAIAALDQHCIQTVVAPSLIMGLDWLPVAILYEPPGNCSWANLTSSSHVGTRLSVRRESDTQTTVLRIEGPFWNREQSSSESGESRVDSQALDVQASVSNSAGTRFGTPISNPGNPFCNSGAEIPVRKDGGPGRGDMFALLKRPDLLAWSSGGKSNAIFDPQSAPSVSWYSAHQIATGKGVHPSDRFSDTDKSVILALDPFVDPDSPLLRDGLGRVIDVRVATVPHIGRADRFVRLNLHRTFGAGVGFEHTRSHALTLHDDTTLATRTRKQLGSTSEDAIQAISLKATGKAIEGGAATLGRKLNTLVPASDLGLDFGAIAKDLITSVLPFYVDKTTVSVLTTLTTSQTVERSLSDRNIQQFYVMDTVRPLHVEIYYDRLFGTYLFPEVTDQRAPPVPEFSLKKGVVMRPQPVVPPPTLRR